MLPINDVLLPQAIPKVAEAYGVTTLATCIIIMMKQIEWHGKPINSGFHHAYLVKGGTKTGYLVAKYLKMVLSNLVLLIVLFTH